MTNYTYLYNDMSTLANFTAYTTWMSGNLATAGWTQTKETGQVMWSGMSLSAVSMSGTNATYTYGSLTGMPLQNGRALTITGMTNSVNNGVFIITAFTGTTSGTFTVVNAAGVNESGSTGAVTKITSVPGTNGYVYEFWQPNDSLTSYVVRIDYGTINNTNTPNFRLWVGTTTNGSGTLYGNTANTGFQTWSGPNYTCYNNYNAYGTSIPFQCYFSGDSGRFNFLMWRAGGNNCTQVLSVERSINSSGVYTGSYVNLVTVGMNGANSASYTTCTQTALHFTYGQVPYVSYNNWSSNQGGMASRVVQAGQTTANQFVNQTVSIDTYAPYVGYFDYPVTQLGLVNPFGLYDGQIITTNLYGASRTYLLSNSGWLPWIRPAQSCMLAFRYD